jgi:hypothetical protein
MNNFNLNAGLVTENLTGLKNCKPVYQYLGRVTKLVARLIAIAMAALYSGFESGHLSKWAT